MTENYGPVFPQQLISSSMIEMKMGVDHVTNRAVIDPGNRRLDLFVLGRHQAVDQQNAIFTCRDADVSPIPDGSYNVFEADAQLGTFTAAELRSGIDVRRFAGGSINDAAGQLARLVTERQRLMRDAWLTHVGHLRPGTPIGKPLEEAQREAEKRTAKIEELRQPQTLELRIVRE